MMLRYGEPNVTKTRTPLSGIVVLHGDPDEQTDPYGVPSFTLVHDGLTTTRRPARRAHAAFEWGRLPEVPYVERYPPRIDAPVAVSLLDVAEALFLVNLEERTDDDED